MWTGSLDNKLFKFWIISNVLVLVSLFSETHVLQLSISLSFILILLYQIRIKISYHNDTKYSQCFTVVLVTIIILFFYHVCEDVKNVINFEWYLDLWMYMYVTIISKNVFCYYFELASWPMNKETWNLKLETMLSFLKLVFLTENFQ